MNYEITCGRCHVRMTGPTQAVVDAAFLGHEKEVHNYMNGEQFYQRFEKELLIFVGESRTIRSSSALQVAKKAAGL